METSKNRVESVPIMDWFQQKYTLNIPTDGKTLKKSSRLAYYKVSGE